MFTRRLSWLPTSLLCLLFAFPVLSGPSPPTTPYDPFHAIAALAPKPSEEPICCLKPLTPLEPVDDDLLLSFEDWKVKRLSESGHSQKNTGPLNAPADSPADAVVHPTSAITTTTPNPSSSSSSSSSPAAASAAAVDAVDAQDTMDAVSTAPLMTPASPHFRVPLTDRFNYASLDCSARVHTAHAAAKSAANILSSQRDRYMLSPCGAAPQFVVVELCEDIRIDTVQLANFEFFSGVFREFTVSVAKTYAATDAEGWTIVGTYVGKNVRGVQVRASSRLTNAFRVVRLCSGFFFLTSRSTRRRPFATFTGTFASTFTRITPTSTTAPSRSFVFMASHTSSSGSGISGRKRVERGRTGTYTPPQSLQRSSRNSNSPRRRLGWPRKAVRLSRRVHLPSYLQATPLRTSRTKERTRPTRLKVPKDTSGIIPTLLGRNPRQVPKFHQPALALLLLHLLHLPPNNL